MANTMFAVEMSRLSSWVRREDFALFGARNRMKILYFFFKDEGEKEVDLARGWGALCLLEQFVGNV